MSLPSLRRSGVALCAAVVTGVTLVAPAHAALVDAPVTYSAPGAALAVAPIGTYETGAFEESAAEIVAYYAKVKRVLTVNAMSGQIDVLDVSDPQKPTLVDSVSGGEGTTINSVAVRADGLAVATVEPADKTAPGQALFFNADDLTVLGTVAVGSLPDMVTITADGGYALVANEGEPAEDYSVDPEGSISVITLPKGVEAAAHVRTADFQAFNGPGALPEGVRIFGQVGASTTVAQNIEPEYITTSGGKAYVSLQENNAIAVIDIATASVEKIFPLGTVDLSTVPMDVSDRDEKINIAKWPVKSFRLPDAIESYEVGGVTYIVTANEGDARDWADYSEEARVKDLGKKDLAPLCEGYADFTAEELTELTSDANLGRLKITTADGLNADGTCYEQIYGFGGRGFSIFAADGTLVFNSDDEFEQSLAQAVPEYFNSNHTESGFDGRSDDKGPEPEGLALGVVDGRTYAFIGLERVGGVMVYDITNPTDGRFVTYVNNRDYSHSIEDDGTEFLSQAGDLGPEGLAFIAAADSPNGKDLLVVGNEVSGTTTIFEVANVVGGGLSSDASSLSSLSSR